MESMIAKSALHHVCCLFLDLDFKRSGTTPNQLLFKIDEHAEKLCSGIRKKLEEVMTVKQYTISSQTYVDGIDKTQKFEILLL